jgi:DNA-binding FadR family transcriptional regulator
MYITEPGTDALAEALFIALRRSGASVWDVEELQQQLLPRIVALAAERATDEEIAALEDAAEHCIDVFAEVIREIETAKRPVNEHEMARIGQAHGRFNELLYAASHNTVLALLSQPLYRLQSLKSWESEEEEPVEESVRREKSYFDTILENIKSRNPERAAKAIARPLSAFPESAKDAMRRTPIGDNAVLPEPLPWPESSTRE